MFEKKRFLFLMLPMLYVVIPIFIEPYVGFNMISTWDVKAFAVFDVLFSYFVFLFVFYNPSYRERFFHEIKKDIAIVSSDFKIKVILYLLIILLFFSVKDSVTLIISGVNRDELHESGAVNHLTILSGEVFKILAFLCVYFQPKKSAVFVLGITLAMLVSASRNEVMYSFFMLLTLFCIFPKVKIFKLVIFTFFLVLLLSIFTIFIQSRGVGDNPMFYIFFKLMTYKSFTFQLAPNVLERFSDFENLPLPFFGRFYEFWAIKFFSISNAASDGFALIYHDLGYNYKEGYFMRANVNYPWWTWWVAAFGPLGLLLKFVYVFMISVTLKFLNLRVTLLYFFSMLLLNSQLVHPLLSTKDCVGLLVVITLDIYLSKFIKVNKPEIDGD